MRYLIFAGLIACSAAPDLNAIEGTTGKVEQCQSEARIAYDHCISAGGVPGPFCNKQAQDAYTACKTRIGVGQ